MAATKTIKRNIKTIDGAIKIVKKSHYRCSLSYLLGHRGYKSYILDYPPYCGSGGLNEPSCC